MNFLRGVTLVLLVGWQAVAAAFPAAHLCRMKEEPGRCHCPHQADKADPHQAKVTSGQCCEQVLSAAHDVTVTPDPSRAFGVVALAVPVPPYRVVSAPPADVSRHWAWAAAPPLYGPPIFLQVRSLLI